jgi:FKBP-type peptidyl-prolyl cis-trans isomerase 2
MSEKIIKKGDTILVEYTGKLETGEIFDTSTGKSPLEFEVGSGQIIKGFDDAVIGMKIGNEKEVKIQAKEAYGEHNKNYVKEIPKKSVPSDLDIKVGMFLMFKGPDGKSIASVVKEIKKDILLVDFNHPLAGKNLTFNIKIVDIR